MVKLKSYAFSSFVSIILDVELSITPRSDSVCARRLCNGNRLVLDIYLSIIIPASFPKSHYLSNAEKSFFISLLTIKSSKLQLPMSFREYKNSYCGRMEQTNKNQCFRIKLRRNPPRNTISKQGKQSSLKEP
jgi:hypothetical protein